MPEVDSTKLPVCVCASVRQVARAITQVYDEALQPAGLTSMQFFILMTIRGHGETSVSQITAYARMDQTTATRALQILEKQRWIEPVLLTDRRKRAFRLTRLGRAVLKRGEPLWTKVQIDALEALGEQDWTATKPILSRILTLASVRKNPPKANAQSDS
ncbi:MAG: winged helix-turn-helix transcriptional regulator [Acidobacteria bacterium]|nr:winged helix-turn-helix transcriptional regulator [Acidobacteriota bacterium]